MDKWRLSERDHTQIVCYYGWAPSYATQVSTWYGGKGVGRRYEVWGREYEEDANSTLELSYATQLVNDLAVASEPLMLQNKVLSHMGKSQG